MPDCATLADVRPGDKIASHLAPCQVGSVVRYTIRGRATPPAAWPTTFHAEADGPDVLVVFEPPAQGRSWPMIRPADIRVRLIDA